MSGNMWYFAENNQQQGPISEDELSLLFANSRLPMETLVWSQGLSNWMPAGQVPAFAGAPQAAPHAVATEAPPQAVNGQFGSSAQAEATGLRDIIRENRHEPEIQHASAPGNGGSQWGDLDAIGRANHMQQEQQYPTAAQPAEPAQAGSWGNLDAIGRGGAAASNQTEASHHGQSENKWGNLDSIGQSTHTGQQSDHNPNAGTQAGGNWGDLDSIGRTSAQQNHHSENNAAAQAQNSWGNLDAIGAPGAAAPQTGNSWGNLDAIGTPATAAPQAENSWGNLDAIVQPQAQSAPQQSSSYGNLDAIGQPQDQSAPQQSSSYGNLDAIGAPSSEAAPAQAAGLASKWGDLDSIGSRSKFTAPTGDVERPELKPHVTRDGGSSQTLKKLRVETAPDVPPAGKYKEAKVAFAGAATSLSVEKNPVFLEPRPWARFGARWIDSIVYSFGILIPVGIMFAILGVSLKGMAENGEMPPAAMIPILMAVSLSMLLYLLIEPLLLCTWGTTPGKAMFGIRLRDAQTGEKLTFVKAMWRTFLFWMYTGQLLSFIPVVGGLGTMGCYWWQYSKLNTTKITSYDEMADVLYEHTRN